jgi:uncharacterized protein YecA (UPF0149 family)
MTAKKVGRNDPCPCGSGKKYKYCCLRRDQQRRRRQVTPSSTGPDQQPRGVLRQVRQLRTLLRQVPEDEARDLLQQVDDLESMAGYLAMKDEIDAARKILEEHRADFEDMMRNPEVSIRRAKRLFSEEPFADLRFTVDELERAFETVGYPSSWQGFSDEDMKILVDATVHLAGDEEDRVQLARQLLVTMPEYVDKGRYLDAWLIQYSAFRLTEVPEESNPFMFVMVELALEALWDEMERKQEDLVHELGIDPSALEGSSMEEIEERLRQAITDPRREAQMEAFYAAHPDLREQATADFVRLEREALKLLERDDVERLLLSPEEAAPWLPVLMERSGPAIAQLQEAAERGERSAAETLRATRESIVEMTQEMASEVFTPERIERLENELRDYRRSLEAAGEEEAAMWIHGVLAVLWSNIPPAQSGFLCGLCFASLRGALAAASDQEGSKGEGADPAS